jgi:antitoxin (DNA-binding transcriptional repressor) of toxin-antitoxin stability system
MKSVKTDGIPAGKSRKKGKRPLSDTIAHKPAHTLSATQAARTFSDLLNRVRYRGEAFVIERGGEPVCEISPVKPPRFTGADLAALLRSLPKPDAGFWDAVEEATRQETGVPRSAWER